VGIALANRVLGHASDSESVHELRVGFRIGQRLQHEGDTATSRGAALVLSEPPVIGGT
jgi:hypothetical protein